MCCIGHYKANVRRIRAAGLLRVPLLVWLLFLRLTPLIGSINECYCMSEIEELRQAVQALHRAVFLLDNKVRNLEATIRKAEPSPLQKDHRLSV